MDGMLSQDEINALLNGMDVGSDSGGDSDQSSGAGAGGSGGGSSLDGVELSEMEFLAVVEHPLTVALG